MLRLFRDPQLPESFRDRSPRDIADFNWLTFSQITPRQMFVPDPEAVGGMTATFTVRNRVQRAEESGTAKETSATEQHRKPLVFRTGIGKRRADKTTIEIPPDKIPQDGKYHLHPIGRITVQEGTLIWALEGGRLGVNVDRVFDPNDPQDNQWDAWMDRVLLARSFFLSVPSA